MLLKKSFSSYNKRPYTLVGTCIVKLSLPVVQQRDLITVIHLTAPSISHVLYGPCQPIFQALAKAF